MNNSIEPQSEKNIHGRNLFLLPANYDDENTCCSYIAHIPDSFLAYDLTHQSPIRNWEFHIIVIDRGAAFSSSANVERYNHYCPLMGHAPNINSQESILIIFDIGCEQ